MCQGPTSHTLTIDLHTEGQAGVWGGAGKFLPCERGDSHWLCPTENPHFLVFVPSGEIKFHLPAAFRVQQRAHGACSNSRAWWALSPVKNPQDNPIINIHSLFFHLIFKLIPTEKVRHILPPSSTLSATLRAFFSMSKRE